MTNAARPVPSGALVTKRGRSLYLRTLAELHGGRLWVAANSPRAANFYFTLPRTPGTSMTATGDPTVFVFLSMSRLGTETVVLKSGPKTVRMAIMGFLQP